MKRMTLRAARKRAGMTATALADRARLNRMTIGRLESGDAPHTRHTTVAKLERELSKAIGEPIELHFPRQPRRAA